VPPRATPRCGGRRGWAASDPSHRLPLASARRTAAALAEAGWVVQALDAHLIVAQLALELGRLGSGRVAVCFVCFGAR
jgi:hypothetical protein